MTIDNYTQMSNEQIATLIASFNITSRKKLDNLRQINEFIYTQVLNRTQFLTQFYQGRPIPGNARLYCIEHNIQCCPTCQSPGCTNMVGWSASTCQFNKYCCASCREKSPEFRTLVEQSCLQHFGVKNPAQSEIVKEKMKQTNLSIRGVQYSLQSEEVKQKIKNTNVRLRGVQNVFQDEQTKHKIRETLQKNFGVDNPSQSKIIQDRRLNTFREKYQVDNPFQSELVKLKIRNTNSLKYGCEYYSQTEEYSKTVHKRYTNSKYPDMTFGSSWEFKVYDFLKEHDIEFEYQLEPIPYEYAGKTYYYIPDFLINGRIYEVKGDMFFRINETTGKEEMYKPWRKPEWSDEYYQWICCKEEAKHQCMLANDVIILRMRDIDSLTIDMFK